MGKTDDDSGILFNLPENMTTLTDIDRKVCDKLNKLNDCIKAKKDKYTEIIGDLNAAVDDLQELKKSSLERSKPDPNSEEKLKGLDKMRLAYLDKIDSAIDTILDVTTPYLSNDLADKIKHLGVHVDCLNGKITDEPEQTSNNIRESHKTQRNRDILFNDMWDKGRCMPGYDDATIDEIVEEKQYIVEIDASGKVIIDERIIDTIKKYNERCPDSAVKDDAFLANLEDCSFHIRRLNKELEERFDLIRANVLLNDIYQESKLDPIDSKDIASKFDKEAKNLIEIIIRY